VGLGFEVDLALLHCDCVTGLAVFVQSLLRPRTVDIDRDDGVVNDVEGRDGYREDTVDKTAVHLEGDDRCNERNDERRRLAIRNVAVKPFPRSGSPCTAWAARLRMPEIICLSIKVRKASFGSSCWTVYMKANAAAAAVNTIVLVSSPNVDGDLDACKTLGIFRRCQLGSAVLFCLRRLAIVRVVVDVRVKVILILANGCYLWLAVEEGLPRAHTALDVDVLLLVSLAVPDANLGHDREDLPLLHAGLKVAGNYLRGGPVSLGDQVELCRASTLVLATRRRSSQSKGKSLICESSFVTVPLK